MHISAVPHNRGPTILIVEDDRSLRDFYRTVLRSAGYEVVAVEDGLDALRVVDSRLPNAIVLDLALPRVRGQEVQRELRSRAETRRIPIIVVTGTDTADLNESDVVTVLRKPVEATRLIEAVTNGLRVAGV